MKTLEAIILVILTAAATNAGAQGQNAGLRLMLGDPSGEFAESVDNSGFGVAVDYGLRPGSALVFGLGIDLMIYGRETTRVSLPLVEDFDLATTNNLADGFFYVQLRPLRGSFQPYLEGRAGWRYMWTESKLEDEDWWDDDEVARETNYDDFTTFMGGGGGLLIRLSRGDMVTRSPGVYLDLKIMHLKGGEARYLSEGDIVIHGTTPVFHPSKSETDLTTYELGVVLTF